MTPPAAATELVALAPDVVLASNAAAPFEPPKNWINGGLFLLCIKQDADVPHGYFWLCAHRKRPEGRCTAEKRDELAPPHCLSQTGNRIVAGQTRRLEVVKLALGNVRFGSKADIAASPTNVRFTPESGHRQRNCDVRFVPKADTTYLPQSMAARRLQGRQRIPASQWRRSQ